MGHYKKSSGPQLSGNESALHKILKGFQLVGLSPTSFPQIETRQSLEPGVPPASHIRTGIPRMHLSILTFLGLLAACDTHS